METIVDYYNNDVKHGRLLGYFCTTDEYKIKLHISLSQYWAQWWTWAIYDAVMFIRRYYPTNNVADDRFYEALRGFEHCDWLFLYQVIEKAICINKENFSQSTAAYKHDLIDLCIKSVLKSKGLDTDLESIQLTEKETQVSVCLSNIKIEVLPDSPKVEWRNYDCATSKEFDPTNQFYFKQWGNYRIGRLEDAIITDPTINCNFRKMEELNSKYWFKGIDVTITTGDFTHYYTEEAIIDRIKQAFFNNDLTIMLIYFGRIAMGNGYTDGQIFDIQESNQMTNISLSSVNYVSHFETIFAVLDWLILHNNALTFDINASNQSVTVFVKSKLASDAQPTEIRISFYTGEYNTEMYEDYFKAFALAVIIHYNLEKEEKYRGIVSEFYALPIKEYLDELLNINTLKNRFKLENYTEISLNRLPIRVLLELLLHMNAEKILDVFGLKDTFILDEDIRKIKGVIKRIINKYAEKEKELRFVPVDDEPIPF